MMYAEIVEGLNLIWNNKFNEAEKIFGAKSTTNPRHAMHYAEVAFLRSFITADSNDTDTAVQRLKSAKKLAEESHKYYEKGSVPPGFPTMDKRGQANAYLDARVVMGDVLMQQAVLQLTRDSKLKGALNMRKSWKVFEDCLKMVSKEPGLYEEELVRCLNFGAGVFFFALSIIPQKFLKLIELVGFKADRDLGLKYIRECYAAGGIRCPFASIVLLFNNLLLPRGLANPARHLREADSLIKESLARYPEGSLFQVMGSHCARKNCDVDAGIVFMETAIENCKTLGVSPLIYKYELANCYCMKMKWDVAASHFEPLVEAEKFQVRALCALQLATCYLMMGEREKAMNTMARVPSLVKKNSSVDPIVAEQAKRYHATGGHFSAFELLYVRRDLVKMEKESATLLELLEKLAVEAGAHTPIVAQDKKGFSSISNKFSGLSLGSKQKNEPVDYSADNRAAYLMLKGAILKSLGKSEEAITCFREAVQLENHLKEKFYVPYSLYELAETLYHSNKLKEAQEAIKKCNNVSGYAWEDPLKVRLRVTMDQLARGGVTTEDEGVPSPIAAATPAFPLSPNGAELNITPSEDSDLKQDPTSSSVLANPIEASS